MKLAIVLCFLALLLVSVPAFAQGNVSILFNGTSMAGDPELFGKFKDDRFSSESLRTDGVIPGIDIRFFQKARVSVGFTYQHAKWSGSEHITYEWQGVLYDIEDRAVTTEADTFITSFYVNLLKRGKVRPYFGVGAGMVKFSEAQVDRTNILTMSAGEIIRTEVHYKAPGITRYIGKGVGGINIFPIKHLQLFVDGGYQGGPAVNFGAGVTF